MVDHLAVADVLLNHGLALFDLPRSERRPTTGWQQRCTTDRRDVLAWVHAGDNLGVGCRASNVVVLDLDKHTDGADGLHAFGELCARHQQPWPTTLTSITPNAGRHLYFRMPSSQIVLSRSGSRSPLGAGIDIRGPGRHTGGYVIGPGSIVPTGMYRILHDNPVLELPAWLAAVIS